MNSNIYVITHKPFSLNLPKGYKKLMVGSDKSKIKLEGYIYDNEGENISFKNSTYCEMTGLYWMWKNAKSDYIGLCHYRRYFQRRAVFECSDGPLTISMLNSILEGNDCIVAKRIYVDRKERNIYGQYCINHSKADLKVLTSILQKNDKKYDHAFATVMHRDYFYPYNMFYSSRELMCDYCKWLFPLLDTCEQMIDISNYDIYQKRIYGFFAERLFNVWLLANKKTVREVPVIQIDTNIKQRALFYKSQVFHYLFDCLTRK
jgi:hypothetical protein